MSKTAQRASAVDRPESFQLKGGLFPMTLLDLKTIDLSAIRVELAEKVVQSPNFFSQSPIVFGLDQLGETEQKTLDLGALCNLCRELKLLPTAIRGGIPDLADVGLRLGLAVLPKGRKATEINAPAAA
jgi:septum site-determining protein MinC